MQATEVLTVVAEISIALAGFTGIVVAYRQRAVEELGVHELIRLRFMLVISCATLMFALFPFLPHYLGAGGVAVWTVSSGALTLGIAGITLWAAVSTRGYLDRLSVGWFAVYTGGGMIFTLVVLANTLAWLAPVGPGLYLVGLGWMLFFSVSLFVRLILAPSASG